MVISRPQETPSEVDKFKDGGYWFCQMARWIVLQYYNTYALPSSYSPQSTSGILNSAGSPTSNGMSSRTVVDEMLDNYEYYFGNQQNRIFNHLTTGMNNQPLPNVWIKGQEIRSLVDHMKGKGIQLIDPIEKNIVAESISENALLKKQDIFDKIDLATQIGDTLNELGGGDVQFQPAGEMDYSDPAQVKNAKKKIREEYENANTVIARSVYFKNQMEQMFLDSVSDTAICNLTGMEFIEANNELKAKYIPGYQCIYDFSTWGQYGDKQQVGGYIEPVLLSDMIKDYKDLNPEWIKEVEDVLYNEAGTPASVNFCEYYNAPFQNVRWWYNNERWISKAVVYWVGKRELPYQKKTNQYGGSKYQKIDPYKTYQVPTGKLDAKGNMTFNRMLGHQMKGDLNVWMVHKAVLYGNKYLAEYGYDTYQVRPWGDKRKPELPIKFLCQGKLAGYVKPIVSRLKSKQDEIDAVRYRIREYTAQDMGKVYFFRGGKLGEGINTKDIYDDLRRMKMTVVPETGDEGSDALGIKDLIHAEDMSNHAYIKEYLTLKQDIENEMRSIVNISEIALGEQSSTIGKGVQQETIARSELAGLSLYSSLTEYWRRCLNYATNKSKMIIADKQNGNVILPVSTREIKMITVTKDMKGDELSVYISPDDNVNVLDMGLLKQALISYSINPIPAGAEAILNIMKILRYRSFGEGIALLEEYVDEQNEKMQKQQMQAATIQHQDEAFQLHSAQIAQQQAEIARLTESLAKINLTGAWQLKVAEANAGHDQAQTMSQGYIDQVTEIVKAQLTSFQQGAAPQPVPAPQ